MDYQLLINKKNKIPEDFIPRLVEVKSEYKKNMFLEEKTYFSFLKLKKYLAKKDIFIEIASAYRTRDYQANLFKELLQEKGLEYANKYLAKPGFSEHESGLALDFCLLKNHKFITEHELLNCTELPLIHQILNKFGFILRYPNGKEKITGYSYEPWHLRYVGKRLAKKLFKQNRTLEE